DVAGVRLDADAGARALLHHGHRVAFLAHQLAGARHVGADADARIALAAGALVVAAADGQADVRAVLERLAAQILAAVALVHVERIVEEHERWLTEGAAGEALTGAAGVGEAGGAVAAALGVGLARLRAVAVRRAAAEDFVVVAGLDALAVHAAVGVSGA